MDANTFKIEDSVLWLKIKNELARENLAMQLKKEALDPSRIIFARLLPMDEHLARYALADIFLDTFNLMLIQLHADALWAGLPVVTKLGKVLLQGWLEVLLTAVGLTELITNTE